MNDELRRKAVIRKGTYFGVILALFIVSMFWRGVFDLPVGDPKRVSRRDEATGKLLPVSGADTVARLPIKYQAEDLELREQDAGDPEVAGALAQVSLVGIRGFVVTWLWNKTTTAQKRGEYHEMERNALLLTKVQPHFITPWVFQAWNIAYNVSVETDKLSDQYYYIARGISLLAEGDRANTRTHRRGDRIYMVGSPDIRYQLGFYAQNKFSVSDKVATLYSLSQLSLLPPSERDPRRYRTAEGTVDPDLYRQFCERNPQLVWRLKTKLNLKKPEQVMEFLETNWRIPARYDVETGERQADDRAFPVLPVADEGADSGQLARYLDSLRLKQGERTAAGPDAIDIRMVARAWFEHALAVVPPPREGVPAKTPLKEEYDRFRYRLPERPALIVVRFSPARAQNYVAERLQKEGWFDEFSTWSPDEGYDPDAFWFPDPTNRNRARAVTLTPGTHARAQWEAAHKLWNEFGERNGLNPANLFVQQNLAEAARAKGVVQGREYTDEQLAALGLTRDHLGAEQAILYYDQNRQITQYQRFVSESLAETEPALAEARRELSRADALHVRDPLGTSELAARLKASALWRKVYTGDRHRMFYTKADMVQESTLAQELAIADLLLKSDDPDTARRVTETRTALAALAPAALLPTTEERLKKAVAADEAQVRLAVATAMIDESNPLRKKASELVDDFRKKFPNSPQQPTLEATARGLLEGDFAWMKTYADINRTVPWVNDDVRFAQYRKDNPTAASTAESDPPTGPAPQNMPGARPTTSGQ